MMKNIPDDFLFGSAPRPSRTLNADAKLSSNGTISFGQAKPSSDDSTGAPIDLMSKFLMLVTENKMVEALELSKEILIFEPNNRIIKEYQVSLKEYIAQGLDLQPKPEEAGEEEEDDEEEEGDEGGDSNEEDDEDDEENSDKENDDDDNGDEGENKDGESFVESKSHK